MCSTRDPKLHPGVCHNVIKYYRLPIKKPFPGDLWLRKQLGEVRWGNNGHQGGISHIHPCRSKEGPHRAARVLSLPGPSLTGETERMK